MKPVDNRGARGVVILRDGVDVNWAYSLALSQSPTNKLILEKYLTGPQVSTESIVVNGQATTIGFSDRNYEFLEKYSPFVIENGGQLPSFLRLQ